MVSRVPVVLALSLALIGCGKSAMEKAAYGPEGKPVIIGVTPSSGSGPQATFAVKMTHPAGPSAVSDMQIRIGEGDPSSDSCWLEVHLKGQWVRARTDDGKDWMSSMLLGANGTVGNKACSANATAVTVDIGPREATVTIPVTFASELRGAHDVFAIAATPNEHSGWQKVGQWTVN